MDASRRDSRLNARLTRCRRVVCASLLAIVSVLAAPVRAQDTDMRSADELLAATSPAGLSDTAEPGSLAPIDPLDLSREMVLRNVYLGMTDGSFRNTFSAELRQPIGENSRFRILAPFVLTDQLSLDTASTSGDMRIGLDMVTHRTERNGLLFGADLVLDTSSEAAGGRGTVMIEPRVVWALYRGACTVIAPSYTHTFGLGGEEWRPDINEGSLALEIGWMWEDGQYWASLVPGVLFNYEGQSQFFSGSIELGCVTGPNSRLHITPSFGASSEDSGEIGADYPYDWGIEVGWRLGFE